MHNELFKPFINELIQTETIVQFHEGLENFWKLRLSITITKKKKEFQKKEKWCFTVRLKNGVKTKKA